MKVNPFIFEKAPCDVCKALTFLLDNICIRFGSKLYRQIVGIPMGTNCAPLVADLFLFCYERDFMLSLSQDNQSDVIEAFNSTSRYLDDLFSKFYRRHFDIVSKYNVGLKTLLLQGLSEPEFYGDLVYKFRKIIGKNDFPYHFKKIIVRYKKLVIT